jgi:hypothetical protein
MNNPKEFSPSSLALQDLYRSNKNYTFGKMTHYWPSFQFLSNSNPAIYLLLTMKMMMSGDNEDNPSYYPRQ